MEILILFVNSDLFKNIMMAQNNMYSVENILGIFNFDIFFAIIRNTKKTLISM